MCPDVPMNPAENGWLIYRELCPDKDALPAFSELDELQYAKARIVSLLFTGMRFREACAACHLSPVRAHMMMKDDETFRSAVNLERDIRLYDKADELERAVWERALDGDRKDSMLLAMYALKALKPEYKEAHQPPSDNRVNVSIQIAGKDFNADFVPDREADNG